MTIVQLGHKQKMTENRKTQKKTELNEINKNTYKQHEL